MEPLEFGENSFKTYTSYIITLEREGTKQNRLARSLLTYRWRSLRKGLSSSWLGSEKGEFKKLQEFSNFWASHPFHSSSHIFPTELNRSKTTWGLVQDISNNNPTKFDRNWTEISGVINETLKFCWILPNFSQQQRIWVRFEGKTQPEPQVSYTNRFSIECRRFLNPERRSNDLWIKSYCISCEISDTGQDTKQGDQERPLSRHPRSRHRIPPVGSSSISCWTSSFIFGAKLWLVVELDIDQVGLFLVELWGPTASNVTRLHWQNKVKASKLASAQ